MLQGATSLPGMGEEQPSMAELAKLRVVDLKARLTELGLPVNGVKKDLVEVGGQ